MDETPTGARTGYSFILPPGHTVEGAVKIASCVRRPVILKPVFHGKKTLGITPTGFAR